MIRVQREPFDAGAEMAALTRGNTAIGGLACFVGLVRDLAPYKATEGTRDFGPSLVRAMTLEHYPGMTERMLAEIEAEAQRRWPLEASLIIHRFGRLEPGDPIVLVATASAGRDAALDSCHFLIDWLKTKAPFWKLEETDEGERWVEARAGDEASAERWSDLPPVGQAVPG